MENCLFRHDNDNSMIATNNFLNTNNNQSASTNMPSTSRQPSKNPTKSISGRDAQNNETDTKIENNTRETTEADKHKPDDEAEEQQEGACASPPLKTSLWVNAPEFVPRTRSYAQALHPEMLTDKESNAKMCPYVNKDGICRNIANCTYLHGEVCDMCERMVLHPFNEDMRKKHRQECIQQHEKNMELSFAIARSKEKTCGVCFEVIMEKATGEQRFGILPNCNHCFCLTCIRKWRQARQFENKIIRACPECRVTSDFVCPSMYWVDTKEDKEKLIDDYKKALSRKDCKYFKKGVGKCPFGNKCFYLHALANGTKCDVGPPPRQRRYRGLDNSDIEVLQQVMLWEFLDEREFPWSLADEIEDLVSFFTDSDESDWSDYDAFFD
ncbi:probable E3 ubiquitin-protein ligase makorin-1 isoform X2 [Aethina tumida]|nr:probable E3 ubiquitin-protein ligase makorin-1 isoform X2 [Aethina tumida]